MCPGPIRSVQHQKALMIMSRTHAPGEKPYLEEIKEQRVTNFGIHMLMGEFLFLSSPPPPLKKIWFVIVFRGVSTKILKILGTQQELPLELRWFESRCWDWGCFTIFQSFRVHFYDVNEKNILFFSQDCRWQLTLCSKRSLWLCVTECSYTLVCPPCLVFSSSNNSNWYLYPRNITPTRNMCRM